MHTTLKDWSTLPIDLDHAKDVAGVAVEYDGLDARLTLLVKQAIDLIEAELGIAIVPQIVVMVLDQWKQPIILPIEPIADGTDNAPVVTYLGSDGSSNEFTDWNLIHGLRPRLMVHSMPTTACRADAITITYGAGYGDSLPPIVEGMILSLVAHWFKTPEAEITGTISKSIEIGFDRMKKAFNRGGTR